MEPPPDSLASLLSALRSLASPPKPGAAASHTPAAAEPRHPHPIVPALQHRHTPPVAQAHAKALLAGCGQLQQLGMLDVAAPTTLAVCPGRDRVFMGHTDSPGLGGCTINAATEGEIACLAQSGGPPGTLTLLSPDTAQYAPLTLQLTALVAAADAVTQKALSASHDASLLAVGAASDLPARARGLQALWREVGWAGYASAALTTMLSSVCSTAAQLKATLEAAESGVTLACISLGLPATGGVSSSAALTGALAQALWSHCSVTHERQHLCEVDLCEYLLGKSAGVADKTAQVFALPGEVSVVTSFPEAFQASVPMPKHAVSVLMAYGPTPRLTTSAGLAWLRANCDPDTATRVRSWAERTMRSCASGAYLAAVEALVRALQQEPPSLLTEEEAGAVLRAVGVENPLLRGLGPNGPLAHTMPNPARHALIYKCLTLIPNEITRNGTQHWPRAAALYGLSELERGAEYVAALHRLASSDSTDHDTAFQRLLECVQSAHDGDRALFDAWAAPCVDTGSLASTEWGKRSAAGLVAAHHVTSEQLLEWAEAPEKHPLHLKAGSFQRSLPSIDAVVDALAEAFPGQAAGRVAAAGLGGCMTLHCRPTVAKAVQAFLQDLGWQVRPVVPALPCQVLHALRGGQPQGAARAAE